MEEGLDLASWAHRVRFELMNFRTVLIGGKKVLLKSKKRSVPYKLDGFLWKIIIVNSPASTPLLTY